MRKISLMLKLKEIFQWRQLLFSLALKDLKTKYRRATGGFGWMLMMPLVQTTIFTFIFRFLFKIKIENYPLFLLSGLFPWAYLTNVINDSSMSIIHNSSLIKKTYFPRQLLPLSVVLTQSITFLFPLLVLVVFSFVSGPKPIITFIWLPLVVLVQMILLLGLALIVSCLNVHYRDVSFIMNILLLVWFYASPIVYSLEMVRQRLPEELYRLYSINPMSSIITAYQDIFFYGQPPQALSIMSLALVACAILVIGFFIFGRYEPTFEELL